MTRIETSGKDTPVVFQNHKGLYFAPYSPQLDCILNNFKGAGTARVHKGILYILQVSFPYSKEILRQNHISYQVRTII